MRIIKEFYQISKTVKKSQARIIWGKQCYGLYQLIETGNTSIPSKQDHMSECFTFFPNLKFPITFVPPLTVWACQVAGLAGIQPKKESGEVPMDSFFVFRHHFDQKISETLVIGSRYRHVMSTCIFTIDICCNFDALAYFRTQAQLFILEAYSQVRIQQESNFRGDFPFKNSQEEKNPLSALIFAPNM